MTKVNMVGEAKKEYNAKVSSQVAVLFGIAMAIYCAMMIHQRIRTNVVDSQLIMSFFTLFLAAYIIYDKKRDIITTMGLYCLGMALTRLPSALLYILDQPNQGEKMLVVGIFFLVISINMLYSAYEYLHGVCRGYVSSTVIILVLWALYAGLFAASLYDLLPDVAGTTYEHVLDKEVLAANVILFSAYLVVLGTDEMRDTCELEYTCRHLETFRSMSMAGVDAALSRKDAKALFTGTGDWKHIDKDPVEYEYEFVVSYTYNTLFGTAQRWKNDDRIFITISASNWEETLVEATRFNAKGMKCEGGDIDSCTHLLFYSNNGDTFRIEVKDDNYEVVS